VRLARRGCPRNGPTKDRRAVACVRGNAGRSDGSTLSRDRPEILGNPLGVLLGDRENCQLGVYTQRGRHNAAVDDKESRDVVCLTVGVNNRPSGIGSHATGPQRVGAEEAEPVDPPLSGSESWLNLFRRGKRGSAGVERHDRARSGGKVNVRGDPEALFMYAGVQARFGDTARALARLTSAVEGGFTVPEALRGHPWLAPLRDSAAFGPLVERAETARREAEEAFREAGGPSLLGA